MGEEYRAKASYVDLTKVHVRGDEPSALHSREGGYDAASLGAGGGKLPNLSGRSIEKAALLHTVESVAHGVAGSLVLLMGESGVGKTALAEWCLGTAAEQFDYLTARATCEPFHAGMSFFPMQELARRLTPDGQTIQHLVADRFGSRSNEAQAAIRAFDDETEPATRREYLVATYANAFIATASGSRPVALFLDDLERIDTPSIDALTVLVSRLGEARMLILGALRSDIVAADPEHNLRHLLERARRDQRVEALLDVGPVDEPAVSEIVADLLGGDVRVPEQFLRRLFLETEGNPMYIREVVRALREKPSASGEPQLRRYPDGSWTFDHPTELWDVPPSVEDAIADRLRPLSKLEREVLDAAAVIGRRCRYLTLLRLTGRSEDEVLKGLDGLMAQDLLRDSAGEVESLEFQHNKVREVVYSQLTGIRRTRLHAQVADVLDDQRELIPPDEWEVAIGSHLLAARKYDGAAPHLLRAGEAALHLQAGQEAADYLRKALDAFEKSNALDPRKVADVRLLLGEALKVSSQLDAALRQLEVVAASDDSPAAQRWAFDHIGDIYKMREETDLALQYYAQCEEAAKAAGDGELLAEVCADLAELHMREAERLAGRDEAAAKSHLLQYETYLDLETKYVSDSTSREAKARSYRNRAKFARSHGDPAAALALYEKSLQNMDEGVASHQFLIPYAKALRLVGRSADAIAQVQSVLAWSRQIGALRSEAIARQYLGLLLMEQWIDRSASVRTDPKSPSGLQQARRELTRALRLHQEVNFRQGYRETSADLFELELQEGNYDAALKCLSTVDEVGPDNQPLSDDQLVKAAVAQLEANGEIGRASRIRALVDKLRGQQG
jgi:hypothetical protein